jgi:eukaryotic-like serine/threonine-protein kinase
MSARLIVQRGPSAGTSIVIADGERIVVGRGADAQLRVEADAGMSRRHCEIVSEPPRFVLRDLGSRHGMLVNGRPVTTYELSDGDRVQAGDTVFEIRIDGAPAHAPTEVDSTGTMLGTNAPPPRRNNEVQPHLPAGYSLVRMLGRGAMGCVYLAIDEKRGVQRAIKQILPQAAMSPEMRARFLREASVQARLVHPNIVQIFDLVEPVPGEFSLIMEFVDGPSADRILPVGGIDWKTAVSIARQALAGLAYAHSRQIVHRDLKEGNLLLARDSNGDLQVKVADFGLAKNYQESGASGMTQEGAFGGTLPYMSREQLLDFRYVGPSADIYAMGATLYRLLTGQFPRDYREGENWVVITLERPMVPIADRRNGARVPATVRSVVEKALATNAADRFATAGEFEAALAAAVS